MLIVRSYLFAAFFFVFTALSSVTAAIISIVLPKHLPGFARWWSQRWLSVYRVLCGVSYRVVGAENLPAGPCILAMKHQSAWDTCALFAVFERPVYVLKNELMWIPFFGWALRQLGCIPVKRGTGRAALEDMVRGTRIALDKNKQVVIFPEGTRTNVGDPPAYKSGISHLYKALDTPFVPVALNTGVFWPRHGMLRPPGQITVQVLPAIPAGLDRKAMLERLIDEVETASRRLSAAATGHRGASPS